MWKQISSSRGLFELYQSSMLGIGDSVLDLAGPRSVVGFFEDVRVSINRTTIIMREPSDRTRQAGSYSVVDSTLFVRVARR
jgi:hypothetical protein